MQIWLKLGYGMHTEYADDVSMYVLDPMWPHQIPEDYVHLCEFISTYSMFSYTLFIWYYIIYYFVLYLF